MGDIRPYTNAELEQRRRDQEDPKWMEWVDSELMESQIRKLFEETIPDMPSSPWSAEGLDRVEQYVLNTFPDVDSVKHPEYGDVVDRITRFIGETFRRNFEGAWYNVPGASWLYPDFGPTIEHGFSSINLDVGNLVTATVDRQWGDYLSGIFTRNRETYDAWVDAGRPPVDEWEQARYS